MVEWWWVLIAFWLGGGLGFLAAGMCRVAARSDDIAARVLDDSHEPAMLARLRQKGGTGV